MHARRLADIATAANLPALSDALLAGAQNSRGYQSAQARRLWHDGAMSAAVAALEGSGAAGRRLQARLAGELAVFQGTAPSLARRDYTPVPGRVLHLLTNSLPHTASGYAQRSHSIMVAQQAGGLGRAGGHTGWAIPCRWESCSPAPATWWTACGTGGSSPPPGRDAGRASPAAGRGTAERGSGVQAERASYHHALRQRHGGPGRGRGTGHPLGVRSPWSAGRHLGLHPRVRRPATARSTGCFSTARPRSWPRPTWW